MAKLRLSKSGMAEERRQLKLYESTLPSLDLKRRQLSVELENARRISAEARSALQALETRIGAELPMLANPDIRVEGLVKMTAFELGQENVVGVKLPSLARIECEVDTRAQLDEALDAGADIVMLDNFDDDEVRDALPVIGDRAIVEVSGGITLERVATLGALGVDVISVGALTHSSPSSDLGLDWG